MPDTTVIERILREKGQLRALSGSTVQSTVRRPSTRGSGPLGMVYMCKDAPLPLFAVSLGHNHLQILDMSVFVTD